MKYWLLIILFFFSFFFFISCEKEKNFDHNTSLDQVFDSFWNQVKTNYAYWNVESTNWDSTYLVYKSKFQRLDINNTSDLNIAKGFFDEMVKNFVDGHFEIQYSNRFNGPSIYYPLYERKKDFQLPFFNYQQIINLNEIYSIDTLINSSQSELRCKMGYIKDRENIAYFHINNFDFLAPNQGLTLSEKVYDFFSDSSKNIGSSLIVDLRNCSGGSTSALRNFLDLLINKEVRFGFAKYKTGLGYFDYSPWLNLKYSPIKKTSYPFKRVMILVNNRTQSLAETIALILKNVGSENYIIGEKSWGALSTVNEIELSFGTFEIPGFFTVYMSNFCFRTLQNQLLESEGITPDYEISFNPSELLDGKDSALQKAIDFCL